MWVYTRVQNISETEANAAGAGFVAGQPVVHLVIPKTVEIMRVDG